MALPEDLISKVRQDFPEDDALQLLLMLSALQKEDPQRFSDRILRCLVVCAERAIEKLPEVMKLASIDWRDLIVAAECNGGSVVRFLSMPFGIHPEIEVFKNWLAGKKIPVPWCAGEEGKWIIETSEMRGLSISSVRQVKTIIPKVLDPGLYIAGLTFLCIQGSREISGAKAIEAKVYVTYRRDPETGEFGFQRFDCRPQDVTKRGKWPAI
jgi:hypothetical protein